MRKLIGTILLTTLFSVPAYADVTHEVVSLVMGGGNGAGGTCPNGAGSEPKQLIEDPDGGQLLANVGYQVPAGYVLEITDVEVTYAQNRVYNDWVNISVVNRANASRKYLAFTAQTSAAPILKADADLHLDYTDQYLSPRGTQHFTLGTGFLVSSNARICIAYTSPSSLLEGPVRLRGRLHPVQASPVPVPPIGGGVLSSH